MLYDLGTNKSIAVPDEAVVELKQMFPEYFKGKPLAVHAKSMVQVKQVNTLDKESDVVVRVKAPNPIGTKLTGSIILEDNSVLNYRYCESAPQVKDGMLKFNWPNGQVDLKHGFTIQQGQTDLLFALVYGCALIDGNKTGKRTTPVFKFQRPAVDAAAKIDKFNKEKELEDFIYNKVDYSLIKEAMAIVGYNEIEQDLPKADKEKVNRVAFYDRFKVSSETWQANALSAMKFGKNVGSIKLNLTEETPSELATRLVEEKKIQLGELGWYDLDKRGAGDKFKAKPFYETTLKGDDARFALIDFWKSDTDSFELFKKA